MLVSGKKYKLLMKENEELRMANRNLEDNNKIHNDKINDLEQEKAIGKAYITSAIGELEEKVKGLEEENRYFKSKRSSTEIMKKQILDMCLFRDKKGRMVKTSDNEILVNEKISGARIWDLVNLM